MKFIKGLNKDASPVDQPEGTYRYAKNILFNETAGAISNEPGNTTIGGFLNNDELAIGSIETTEDSVIFFTVDSNGASTIYLYNTTNDTNSVVLTTTAGNVITGSDVDLKFNKSYPIEGTYKIDPNGELIIYFTDNLNPPRSLNITRQIDSGAGTRIYGVNPVTSTNKNYIDRINLFPHSGPVPSITFSRIANGGALKSGVYYLFLAYVDKNFTQTNYVSYSLGVPIVEDDEGVKPIERYDGCQNDTQTGKSIVWTATNLNTDYEFLRPIVVHRSGDSEFAFRLNDLDINSASGTIVFSGLEGYESSSIEDAIIDTVAYDTAKTLEQLDGVLYIGNLSGTKDIGYQPYANFIKTESVVDTFDPFDVFEISADNLEYGYLDTIPTDVQVRDQGYRHVDNLSGAAQRKGYTRDEVYAFYIAFILNDGTMSYAYHIPGRAALSFNTADKAADVRKVGLDDTGLSYLESIGTPTFSETNLITDPGLLGVSQNLGQLFQFYEFSHFGGSTNNMNFWHNANEFYPNTEDYETIDANNPGVVAEDLRGTNVRHHHMPTNNNSSREMISDNNDTFAAATESETIVYYFAVGNPRANGSGQDLMNEQNNNNWNTQDALEIFLAGQTNTISSNGGTNDFDGIFDDHIFPLYGSNTADWQSAVPSVGTEGVWAWTKGPSGSGNASGGGTFTVTGDGQSTGHYGAVSEPMIMIDQDEPNVNWDDDLANNPDAVTYAILVWSEVVPAVAQNGYISQTVHPLGIKMSDIKVPQSIADKVQGFRIYYAERQHSNRRILGQDVLKTTRDIDDKDLSGCFNAGGGGVDGLGRPEDFILSPGTIYDGDVANGGGNYGSVTFHDFYLLNRRNSLVPATHTSIEYGVGFLSFLGPGHEYQDVDNDWDENCIAAASYSSFHVGRFYNNLTTNTFIDQHFPIREKCKTYLNADSIYDGRGIGFGKRVYNIGGESSILLAFNPDRRPNAGAFNAAPDAWWHEIPSTGAPFAFEDDNNFVRMQSHNLHAYKTDMYLSYDTQELVWTGYEVVGEEFENFIVDATNTSLGNHTTPDIFGGDTYICRHGYRITHRPEFDGARPYDHKAIIYTIAESTDNINFRHETDIDSTYFPGSPAKKLLDKKADVDFTKKENMNYASHYSLGVADVKPPIPYPLRESDPSIFQTRVQRSAKDDNAGLIDNYRVFKALQFKDLPRNRGSLWKLATISNLLYMHTEDSLFRTKGKQSLKLADGTESFVGSGDIFAQEPDEIIQTKFGYGGTQSQWVSMVTKHGYFCMDYRNRRVFMFKDTLYDISRSGLESWFQDNIPYALEQYGLPPNFDNPIQGIGFHAEYDERYDRILLTKRDKKPTNTLLQLFLNNSDGVDDDTQTVAIFDSNSKKFARRYVNQTGTTVIQPINFDDTTYFEDSGWTISYDVELNVWASFHDYIPYKYTRSKDVLASFTEGNRFIWGHQSEGDRGRFYSVNYSTEFEFIYNSSKDLDKVFYSFEYMVDVTSDHAPAIDGGQLKHDHGFNSFYVYTTHQISGETPIEYMINTRRVGNEWKINKFRDLADLTNSIDSLYTGPFGGGNFGVTGANVAGTITTGVETHSTNAMFTIDGMTESINPAFINLAKSWDKQRKFTDKWIGIRLKYDNITKKLINLYTTDVAAKKFYR